MAIKCDQCGLVAPDKKVMREYWPGADAPALHFCPACWRLREKRTHRLEAQFLLLVVALIVVGAAFVPTEHGGALGRIALMIVLVEIVATVLHECGHALAAWAMRHRVFVFSVGMGLELWRKRIGGTDVRFHLLPTCGYVMHGSRSLRFGRFGHFVISAAGPAVNLLLAAVGFYMIGGDLSLGADDTAAMRLDAVTLWHIVFGVNAVIVVMNVVPMSFRTEQAGMAGGYAANDGMHMILALTMQGKTFVHFLAQSVRYQIDDLIEQGEPDAAVQRSRAAIEEFPWLAPLRLVYADTLNRLGYYDDARFALDPMILQTQPNIDVDTETRIASCVTGARIELDDPQGDAPTADHLSKQATDAAPFWPDARIERARALVANGWVAKGVEQLANMLASVDDESVAAEICCHLATAELEQGDPDQAGRYADLARSLDEKCRYLPALDEKVNPEAETSE